MVDPFEGLNFDNSEDVTKAYLDLKKTPRKAGLEQFTQLYTAVERLELNQLKGWLAYSIAARSFVQLDEPRTTIKFCETALRFPDSLSHKETASLLNIKGAAKGMLNNVVVAIDDLHEAIIYAEQNVPEEMVYAIGNLSMNYLRAGDTIQALHWMKRSLDCSRAITDSLDQAYNFVYDFSSIASLQFEIGQFDSARLYCDSTMVYMKLLEASNYRKLEVQSVAYTPAVKLAVRDKDFDALLRYVDTFNIADPVEAKRTLAAYAEAKGDYRKALFHTRDTIFGDTDYENIRLEKRKLYFQKLGMLDSALYVSNFLVKDLSEAKFKELKQLSQFNKDRHDRAIELQSANDRIHRAQVKLLASQKRQLVAIIVCLFLGGGMLLVFSRYKRSRNQGLKLTEKVDYQAVKLELANERLLARLRELERFNHLISHDLREPVRSIVSFSALAKRKVASQPEAAEAVEFVRKGALQLQALLVGIESLLEVDQQQLNFQKSDINQLLDSHVRAVRQKHPGTSIHATSSEGIQLFSFDEKSVGSILGLLISNSIKFSGSQAPDILLHSRLDPETGDLLLSVRDQGIGFSLQYSDQIFETFKRLNRREDYQGSGIGLALARKIAINMGGQLSCVRAQPSLGCTFEIRISPSPFQLQDSVQEESLVEA
ncbi:MAG: ATP-binding protein [Saprospiraceae bacterium]